MKRYIHYVPLYTAFLCIYLISNSGYFGGDRYFRFLAAVGLVEHGSPALPADLLGGGMTVTGKDGQPYSFYGIGQTLLFVPFIFVGKLIKMYPRYDLIGEWVFTTLNCFVGAALIVVVWWLVQRLGYAQRVASAVALVAGLASPIWVEFTGGGVYVLETLMITTCLAGLLHASNTGSKVST